MFIKENNFLNNKLHLFRSIIFVIIRTYLILIRQRIFFYQATDSWCIISRVPVAGNKTVFQTVLRNRIVVLWLNIKINFIISFQSTFNRSIKNYPE